MDTSVLETYITLAEEKNFTKTAAHLFVAQSTVTNRIAQLEEEVGQTLVIRNNKSVSLTDAGQLYLKYAKKILDLEKSALREISMADMHREDFRIGSTNTFYECHIFPYMKKFLKEHTELAVDVTIGHTMQLLDMLQEDQLDIAFTYSPLQKPDFTCRLYNTEDLILVTRPDQNDFKNGIKQKDLDKLYYIFCNFALRDVGAFIRELFPPLHQFPFEIDNSTRILSYLLEGLGASFLPESLVRDALDKGQLSQIPLLDFQTPKINSYMTYRTNNDMVKLWKYE